MPPPRRHPRNWPRRLPWKARSPRSYADQSNTSAGYSSTRCVIDSSRIAHPGTDNFAMSDQAPEAGEPPRVAAWKRALGLGLLVLALAALASSDTIHQTLLRLVGVAERIIAAQPTLGATLFVVFSALSAMIAFFSTAV